MLSNVLHQLYLRQGLSVHGGISVQLLVWQALEPLQRLIYYSVNSNARDFVCGTMDCSFDPLWHLKQLCAPGCISLVWNY